MVIFLLITIVDRIYIAYILFPILGYKFFHQGWDLRFLDQFRTVLVGGSYCLPEHRFASIVGMFSPIESKFYYDLAHVKLMTRCGIISV